MARAGSGGSTTSTDANVNALAVTSNGTGGTNFFAGTWGGVFLSTDNGASWSLASTGLPKITDVRALVVSPNGTGGTNLFAGTEESGVFLSTNNGTNWSAISNNVTIPYISALAVSPDGAGGTNLFAGTGYGGVFLSTNNGTSWSAARAGLTGSRCQCSCCVPQWGRRHESFCRDWWRRRLSFHKQRYKLEVPSMKDCQVLVYDTTTYYVGINCFALSGQSLFVGTDRGAFLSTNNGTSWTAASKGCRTNTSVCCSCRERHESLCRDTDGGVFRSTRQWHKLDCGERGVAGR